MLYKHLNQPDSRILSVSPFNPNNCVSHFLSMQISFSVWGHAFRFLPQCQGLLSLSACGPRIRRGLSCGAARLSRVVWPQAQPLVPRWLCSVLPWVLARTPAISHFSPVGSAPRLSPWVSEETSPAPTPPRTHVTAPGGTPLVNAAAVPLPEPAASAGPRGPAPSR